MSFKKKILLICCVCVLISATVCSVAVYSMVKRISLDAAQGQSFRNASALFSELEEKFTSLNTGQNHARDVRVLEYLMKKQNDELLLCFSAGNEIFNSTVFQQDDLEALSYQSVSAMELSVDMAEMKWEDRHFLVFRQEENNVGVLYKLEDISYVWSRMEKLGLALFLLTAVITVVVCLALYIILNRMMRPLQRLNDGAKQIAMGQYEERIVVEKNDEIGELSNNFNQMAEAVQSRIQRLKETEQKRTLFMGNLTHELKTPMTAIY
ncbi:MAG: HAMP domain-containing protein [Lachnospiraceae bacterium]|nr:HAMP domain-containing protein [Lachnospiraceae bacterium]